MRGAVAPASGEADARARFVLPDRDAAIVASCSNEACPNSGEVAD